MATFKTPNLFPKASSQIETPKHNSRSPNRNATPLCSTSRVLPPPLPPTPGAVRVDRVTAVINFRRTRGTVGHACHQAAAAMPLLRGFARAEAWWRAVEAVWGRLEVRHFVVEVVGGGCRAQKSFAASNLRSSSTFEKQTPLTNSKCAFTPRRT